MPADQQLKQVTGLLGVPFGRADRPAIAEDAEPAQRADKYRGPRRCRNGAQEPGRGRRGLPHTEGTQALLSLGHFRFGGTGRPGQCDGIASAGEGIAELRPDPRRLPQAAQRDRRIGTRRRPQLERLGETGAIRSRAGEIKRAQRRPVGLFRCATLQRHPARGEQRDHPSAALPTLHGPRGQRGGVPGIITHEHSGKARQGWHQPAVIAKALGPLHCFGVGVTGQREVTTFPVGIGHAEQRKDGVAAVHALIRGPGHLEVRDRPVEPPQPELGPAPDVQREGEFRQVANGVGMPNGDLQLT